MCIFLQKSQLCKAAETAFGPAPITGEAGNFWDGGTKAEHHLERVCWLMWQEFCQVVSSWNLAEICAKSKHATLFVWQVHSSLLTQRLWGEEALADVVIATGDHHQITAHKVILRQDTAQTSQDIFCGEEV